MQSLRLVLCLLLLSSLALAQAPAPPTPQMSPIVTWDPDREISRPPTRRPLTAAELKAARARADRFYDLVKATPSFSQPAKHATLVTAWCVAILHPGNRHAEVLFGLLEHLGSAGNLTTDAHLAALCVEHQAELHSTDADFSRFPGLRWKNPAA